MNVRRNIRQTVGTSAAVVLAAVVNAAVANPAAATSHTPFSGSDTRALAGNLTWAVSGGGTAARSARVLIAEKAVHDIHSQDRISGAYHSFAADVSAVVIPADAVLNVRPGAEDHARSTHQNSAP